MVHIAIPAMDEPGLPEMLLTLNRQHLLPRSVCVCINQPASYYRDGFPEHARICRTNSEVYTRLAQMKAENRFLFDLYVIDRFSPEKAWDAKHFGVGWARKTAMDFLFSRFGESGLLVCMDADTAYPDTYLEDMCAMFARYPKAVGMANPYYHALYRESDAHSRALLHYEVYMRAYGLNMLLTGHPYAFTAVGSSMACTLKAYRKIGGITPFKSGEDFYFLQKLAKTGSLIVYSPSVSFPSCRLSGRVFFGTGPALQKGIDEQWKSYPLYPSALFERMRQAYGSLPDLFGREEAGPEFSFWEDSFGPRWHDPVRAHSGGRKEQFVHACTEKFDALRSLQYLKAAYRQDAASDWENLRMLCGALLETYGDRVGENAVLPAPVSAHAGERKGARLTVTATRAELAALCRDVSIVGLDDLTLRHWNLLRDFLFLCERHLQCHTPLLPSW